MNKQILNVNHLKKSFGKTEILHGIKLTVSKGEVYCLVGQNGDGQCFSLAIRNHKQREYDLPGYYDELPV